MTLSRKLYGIMCVVLVILITVSVISYVSLRSAISSYKTMLDFDSTRIEVSMVGADELGQAIQEFNNFLIRGDEHYVAEWTKHVEAIGVQIEILGTLANDGKEKENYLTSKKALDEYKQMIVAALAVRKKTGDIISTDRNFASAASARFVSGDSVG